MKVIGVRFKKAGKIYYFDPVGENIQKGDHVIVDTVRGLECGEVVIGEMEFPDGEKPANCPHISQINKIHRKATKADLARVKDNKLNEQKAFEICREKIIEHDLPMKLINVSYTFDVNKIIFYFTAESRVDFRDLVRDLAYIFHTRIELRQVGVRDDAKRLGGTGCCGRPLCCANFLGDFAPVSIRMAKEQNLSLNPAKISGICGRLLCCLKFESEYYHEKYMENFKSFQPARGDKVIVSEGEGRIVAVNYQVRTATVLLDNRRTVAAPWEDILPVEIAAKNPSSEDFFTDTAMTETSEFEKIPDSEEIFVEKFEEEKIIVEEKISEPEPKKRGGHYNRKANYNKKFRAKNDKKFSDDRGQKKNFKSRRPNKNGDFKK
ncbi:MAG: stage 0 sporulation family protein [Selenomonadaceae bacterium]|nr:stage 0 sporulation family protein [Selenomonadaceae bacterium]